MLLNLELFVTNTDYFEQNQVQSQIGERVDLN
jgi:hypothetical protein